MSGRGKSRADAPRVRRAKRQADARNETDGAAKKQKIQDQLDDHEVVETLSLSGNASEPQSGIGISGNEKPEGIVHFIIYSKIFSWIILHLHQKSSP